jgi:hypothetical protein
MVKPTLRQLSCPYDFLSNLVVDFFLLITVSNSRSLPRDRMEDSGCTAVALHSRQQDRALFFLFLHPNPYSVCFSAVAGLPRAEGGRMNHD